MHIAQTLKLRMMIKIKSLCPNNPSIILSQQLEDKALIKYGLEIAIEFKDATILKLPPSLKPSLNERLEIDDLLL